MAKRGSGPNGGGDPRSGGAWARGGRAWATFGAPARSLPPEMEASRVQSGSGGGWRRKESRNADRVVDPMSLVASPSRGTDPASSDSLLSEPFQESFHAHLRRRLATHRQGHPDPLLPLILHATERAKLVPADEAVLRADAQVVSGQQLVGEWRKLREGIVASGRMDRFACQVYEESAELAIETLDWPQLASLLPYLIHTLHPHLHTGPSLQSALDRLQLTDGSRDDPPAPQEDDQDRQAMFAAALLILPLALRLDLTDFCPTLLSLTSSTNGIRPSHPHIRCAWRVFRLVRRSDLVGLSRALSEIALPLRPMPGRARPLAIHHRLLYPLLPVFRRRVVWPTLRKAYYQLSDPLYASRCLCFPADDQAVPIVVRLWIEKVGGLAMSEHGVVVFREPARPAPAAAKAG